MTVDKIMVVLESLTVGYLLGTVVTFIIYNKLHN